MKIWFCIENEGPKTKYKLQKDPSGLWYNHHSTDYYYIIVQMEMVGRSCYVCINYMSSVSTHVFTFRKWVF